ncbi:Hpt domain-containing protein [Halobacteriovorax sp. HLS]|uniref:Hpt domain-containing protein n=1 Tax=Halobacteriovorax sp. HLS TaxID=2234000 RepID=UPI000FD82A23|nr:Hpt domain-containing protein [Halobacteriovorax sp. HLS]
MSSFDQSKLNEYFEDEKDILGDLIVDFFEELPAMLEPIKKSIEELDASGLQISAHTLKGSVSNFFAAECVEHAYFLEKMGRDGSVDASVAMESFNKLDDALKVLNTDLVNYSKGF